MNIKCCISNKVHFCLQDGVTTTILFKRTGNKIQAKIQKQVTTFTAFTILNKAAVQVDIA